MSWVAPFPTTYINILSATSKVKKLPTLLEELCSREKGSEAEQQLILRELNVSTNTPCTFVAGKIKYYNNNWKNITIDRSVLDIVKYGVKMTLKINLSLLMSRKFHIMQKKKAL